MLAIFNTVADATQAISRIIGAGIVPAALEMMDQGIIGALEEAFHFGFPLDAGAVLLIEVDGLDCVVEPEAGTITELCLAMGAREVRRSRTEEDRAFLWKCRKQAFGAVGRLAPSYCTQDGVVPRTALPEMLRSITAIGNKHQLRIANVFHAGDGNLHPILLFDEATSALDSHTEKDIQEAARALTGWTFGVRRAGRAPAWPRLQASGPERAWAATSWPFQSGRWQTR